MCELTRYLICQSCVRTRFELDPGTPCCLCNNSLECCPGSWGERIDWVARSAGTALPELLASHLHLHSAARAHSARGGRSYPVIPCSLSRAQTVECCRPPTRSVPHFCPAC